MKATIKTFNKEWKTSYVVETNPLTVTDGNGHVLDESELALWVKGQDPVLFEGKRHTPETDVDSWLRGLSARKYTYLRVDIDE